MRFANAYANLLAVSGERDDDIVALMEQYCVDEEDIETIVAFARSRAQRGLEMVGGGEHPEAAIGAQVMFGVLAGLAFARELEAA